MFSSIQSIVKDDLYSSVIRKTCIPKCKSDLTNLWINFTIMSLMSVWLSRESNFTSKTPCISPATKDRSFMEIIHKESRRLIPLSKRKLGPKIEASVPEQKFIYSCHLSPQHDKVGSAFLDLLSSPCTACRHRGLLSLSAQSDYAKNK